MTPDEVFELALAFTLGKNVEGGYTVDQGGPTNHGVTQSNYSAWLRSHNLASKDVREITSAEVKQFYCEWFWLKPKLDQLAQVTPITAIAVFDFGVNAYWIRAVALLQSMLHIVADGHVGPNTCHAAHIQLPIFQGDLPLAHKFNEGRRAYYEKLCAENPEKYGEDHNGWINRVNNLDVYLDSHFPQTTGTA